MTKTRRQEPGSRGDGPGVPASASVTGSDRPFLLDVSRLIWRLWSGRLPTGIDRVCLAYLAHFGSGARAVVQWKGRRLVLGSAASRRLMAVMLAGGPRLRLAGALVRGLPGALLHRPWCGQLYLNIGHTGLNDPNLVAWIACHGLRAIHFVHDLIPIETPQFCRPGEADRHAERIANALASASGVIGNSQGTLDALQDFAIGRRLPLPPMVAAWLAADGLPADAAAVVTDRPFFVVVGTIEARKNHLLLLRIWERLVARMGDDAPRLMVVGQRGWEVRDALALLDGSTLAGAVVERGRCSDAELAGLLKGARALLMPSFVEGFGMPVVEALRLGVPVIASDLPVFREIAGNIPTYLPPLDPAGWERAILDFCGDVSERARQVAAMQDYRAPDWPGHFTQVERWLETL